MNDCLARPTESMSASAQQLSRTVVELVARAREPVALPAVPHLPASVLEQAPRAVRATSG